MDEVIPGLWIGNMSSALDTETLKAKGIYSIVSAMRGKVSIHETFIKHQILLDDTEDADILIHFLPCITFIQSELGKGRGVLVHCQAGISRSATIVAAYLMHNRRMSPDAALELIRKARPEVDPNPGFLAQLEIFHQASFRISQKDKPTRMFYMERAVDEVMNGDGTLPSTDMFAHFPRTPSDSTPTTPNFTSPRRRIRCKMCRQELAAREHMLDHGQLGPATPATMSPATSRRPSTNQATQPPSRRLSATNSSRSRLPSDTRPRRPSGLSFGGTLGDMLAMSSLNGTPSTSPKETDGKRDGLSDEGDAEEATAKPKTSPGGTILSPPLTATPQSVSDSTNAERKLSSSGIRPFANLPRSIVETLSVSALETEDESTDEDEDCDECDGVNLSSSSSLTRTKIKHPTGLSGSPEAAAILGRRLSDAMITVSPVDLSPPGVTNEKQHSPLSISTTSNSTTTTSQAPQSYFHTPGDLADQLHSNPKLAALRGVSGNSSNGVLTTTTTGTVHTNGAPSPVSPVGASPRVLAPSAPILMNPKCSGYFVEPMRWMEPFLEQGELAGKIICPNKKCGAKLGNYDWAGVKCGCKEWVTPGFCINRSKVDEIVN